ncbi:hypothetical protein PoB_003519700 [Plakobranchus ocellatus]|uniref:Uncharacterized protein n=1 Tax=Plakobranchus ocellatus TaxID=259542 RepID=A0AAV4AN55_9GAST|nr:hypothetical protein PoB_003519700 [Plakobranchus ocellatus]
MSSARLNFACCHCAAFNSWLWSCPKQYSFLFLRCIVSGFHAMVRPSRSLTDWNMKLQQKVLVGGRTGSLTTVPHRHHMDEMKGNVKDCICVKEHNDGYSYSPIPVGSFIG